MNKRKSTKDIFKTAIKKHDQFGLLLRRLGVKESNSTKSTSCSQELRLQYQTMSENEKYAEMVSTLSNRQIPESVKDIACVAQPPARTHIHTQKKKKPIFFLKNKIKIK